MFVFIFNSRKERSSVSFISLPHHREEVIHDSTINRNKEEKEKGREEEEEQKNVIPKIK